VEGGLGRLGGAGGPFFGGGAFLDGRALLGESALEPLLPLGAVAAGVCVGADAAGVCVGTVDAAAFGLVGVGGMPKGAADAPACMFSCRLRRGWRPSATPGCGGPPPGAACLNGRDCERRWGLGGSSCCASPVYGAAAVSLLLLLAALRADLGERDRRPEPLLPRLAVRFSTVELLVCMLRMLARPARSCCLPRLRWGARMKGSALSAAAARVPRRAAARPRQFRWMVRAANLRRCTPVSPPGLCTVGWGGGGAGLRGPKLKAGVPAALPPLRRGEWGVAGAVRGSSTPAGVPLLSPCISSCVVAGAKCCVRAAATKAVRPCRKAWAFRRAAATSWAVAEWGVWRRGGGSWTDQATLPARGRLPVLLLPAAGSSAVLYRRRAVLPARGSSTGRGPSSRAGRSEAALRDGVLSSHVGTAADAPVAVVVRVAPPPPDSPVPAPPAHSSSSPTGTAVERSSAAASRCAKVVCNTCLIAACLCRCLIRCCTRRPLDKCRCDHVLGAGKASLRTYECEASVFPNKAATRCKLVVDADAVIV